MALMWKRTASTCCGPTYFQGAQHHQPDDLVRDRCCRWCGRCFVEDMAVHLAAASLEVGLAAASLEALGHEFGVRGVDLKEVSAGPMMFLAVVASINSASKPHCFEHLVLGWSCKGSPYVDSQVIPSVLRVCRHVHGLIVSTETYAIYTHPKHP